MSVSPALGNRENAANVSDRPQSDPPVLGRMEFPNGYAIDIDDIWQGQVLYRVWPPGVDTQGMFDRAYRMPIADFAQAVAIAHDEAARAGEQGESDG